MRVCRPPSGRHDGYVVWEVFAQYCILLLSAQHNVHAGLFQFRGVVLLQRFLEQFIDPPILIQPAAGLSEAMRFDRVDRQLPVFLLQFN